MKAELITGEIVTLEKDCGCCSHNGPHWVYADDQWKALNRQIPRDTIYGVWGFAREEQARLGEKLRIFKQLGINRVIRESCDELTEIQKAQIERNRLALLKQLECERKAQEPKRPPTRQELRQQKEDVQIEARRRL